jgi:hypothetical protein
LPAILLLQRWRYQAKRALKASLPQARRVTALVDARRLTMGRPKPPVPPFRSGGGICGTCGLLAWTGQLQGAGAAVTQDMGDRAMHSTRGGSHVNPEGR